MCSSDKDFMEYQPLQINMTLPEDLQDSIDAFLHYINYEKGLSEDCYRSEIDMYLKDAKSKIPAELYDLMKDYYVHGGIYKAKIEREGDKWIR